jgi:hypothetical protein
LCSELDLTSKKALFTWNKVPKTCYTGWSWMTARASESIMKAGPTMNYTEFSETRAIALWLAYNKHTERQKRWDTVF